MSTAPAYFFPLHRPTHSSSVNEGSVPDRSKELNPEVEAKQPRYENTSMEAGLCLGTMVSTGEIAADWEDAVFAAAAPACDEGTEPAFADVK